MAGPLTLGDLRKLDMPDDTPIVVVDHRSRNDRGKSEYLGTRHVTIVARLLPDSLPLGEFGDARPPVNTPDHRRVIVIHA